MMIKVAGQNIWLWDVIEARSRFLLATHLTMTRNMRSAVAVLAEANGRTIGTPSYIVSDGMPAYPDAIERVFGADSEHIQAKGLTAEINTNIIERFQGTVKERTKVMKAFRNIDTLIQFTDGFLVYYNYFKPHHSLKGKTPAEVANVDYDVKNWMDVCHLPVVEQTEIINHEETIRPVIRPSKTRQRKHQKKHQTIHTSLSTMRRL